MELMRYLRNLCPSISPQLRVCVSCRPWPGVISDSQKDYDIPIESENENDIWICVHSLLQGYMNDANSTDLTEIEYEIATRASGVFQWAVLVTTQVISDLMSEHEDFGKEYVLAAIRKIPEELNDIYQSMFDHLGKPENQKDRVLALQILRWITFAARPLSLLELRYAVTFDLDNSDGSFQNISDCE